MHLQLCAWLFISGVWYNTQYIKSIRHQTSDILEDTYEPRPCFFGDGPCYNSWLTKIKIGQVDEYVLQIANTDSAGDDMGPIRDLEIKVNNKTEGYLMIKDFIDRCLLVL